MFLDVSRCFMMFLVWHFSIGGVELQVWLTIQECWKKTKRIARTIFANPNLSSLFSVATPRQVPERHLPTCVISPTGLTWGYMKVWKNEQISPGIYGYLWVNGPNYLLPNEVPCLRLSAVSGLKNALCSVWIYMPRKTSLTGHSLPLRAQNPELTRQVLDILATALSFLGGSARRRGDIEEFVHSYPRCWWIGLGHLKPFKRSFCCCQE